MRDDVTLQRRLSLAVFAKLHRHISFCWRQLLNGRCQVKFFCKNMYWTPAKMLSLADVDVYSFANAALVGHIHRIIPIIVCHSSPYKQCPYPTCAEMCNRVRIPPHPNYYPESRFLVTLKHKCKINWSHINTVRPTQNSCHFTEDIFKLIFFNEICWNLIPISVKYVPKGPIDSKPVLVRILAWNHTHTGYTDDVRCSRRHQS